MHDQYTGQHQKAVIVVPPGTDRLGIFPLWDLFELVLGYLGPVLGGSGPVLGLFWAVLGLSWAGLGLSGAVLGLSWSCLGAWWLSGGGHGVSLKRVWSYRGPSWARLEVSWACLKEVLGSSWLSRACLGLVLGCLRQSWKRQDDFGRRFHIFKLF